MRIYILLLVLFSVGCSSQIDYQMAEFRGELKRIASLEKREILSVEQANEERLQILAMAEKYIQHPISQSEIETWQQRSGIVTFKNVLIIIGGIALALALCWLGWLYLHPFIVKVPIELWQLLAYIVVFPIVFFTPYLWMQFVGCLLFIGVFHLTQLLHLRHNFDEFEHLSLLCAVLWSIAAVYHQSSLIGFIAVIALQGFLGFSVLASPFCIAIGFNEESIIARTTTFSLCLMLIGIFFTAFGNTVPSLSTPFATGLLFMGTFVYFTGLLIMSSEWYHKNVYWRLQIITILSGFGVFYLGSLLQLDILLSVGGTFFTCYLLEKWIEVSWKEKFYAWSALGIGIFLILLYHAVEAFPEWFIF